MDTNSENQKSPASGFRPRMGYPVGFNRMKIMVIDDEPANVALLEAILSEQGFERIRCLTDSRAALATYSSFEPDLLLLDLMMPHVDGFAILEAIRVERGDLLIPIVVLTADVNEKTKFRALAAGATDFLLKPFDQVEVLLRMNNLLMARHLQIQLDTQRAALEDALRARDEAAR